MYWGYFFFLPCNYEAACLNVFCFLPLLIIFISPHSHICNQYSLQWRLLWGVNWSICGYRSDCEWPLYYKAISSLSQVKILISNWCSENLFFKIRDTLEVLKVKNILRKYEHIFKWDFIEESKCSLIKWQTDSWTSLK